MAQPEIKVHDTLTGKKLAFRSRKEGLVRIYGCGPTVYGLAHVGNGRAFLMQDLVCRVLRHAGYKVEFARNYTDIDDKIIDRARQENKSSEEVAEFFSKTFDKNIQELDILKPEFTPRATTSIPAIIEMISALEKKGFAYELKGDVYYRVNRFSPYGKLSHRKLDDMLAGFRIDPNEAKEHPADFALWKASKPGEPSWKSPWGDGRPGWHIECSAMIHELFQDEIDIHMGGLDLIFPHHENEIAQSEALTQKPLANYWVHTGMLEVAHEKMSKSLGNLMTISDFNENYGYEALRVLAFQHHYRGPLEFSTENILRAEALVERLYSAKMKYDEVTRELTVESPLSNELLNLKPRLEEALYDDFNAPKAFGFILAAIRACFRSQKPSDWKALSDGFFILQNIFALTKAEPQLALSSAKQRRLKRMNITEARAAEIDDQLKQRDRLRSEKKFAEADQVRNNLEAAGIQVMDGPDGVSWSVK